MASRPVRLDPWANIVDVHWEDGGGPTETEPTSWFVFATAGMPSPPFPEMDYDGWEDPIRVETNRSETGVIQVGPVYETSAEAEAVLDAYIETHGPLAVYVLETNDLLLPVNDWTTVIARRGFLPFTVGWGRQAFNFSDPDCPPQSYLIHEGWKTQERAQAYIEWSGRADIYYHPEIWNSADYMRGSVSIIQSAWATGSIDPPNPDPIDGDGTAITCADSSDFIEPEE